MIGKKVLHYEIVGKLGEGGMGTVYLAEDTKLERKVALKFLSSKITSDDNELSRFLNEAKISASLNHPNIAQVYAMEESEEGSFISMQYVSGQDLKDLIEKENPPIDQKIDISYSILQGLHAAHQKKIIHRDVKASNIMISDEGEVKILDFGLARIESSMHLTTAGETRGTSLYMAPELIMGNEATEQTDIWAYGVVLYQLFSKELPFDGVYEQAITYAILDEDYKPLREINAHVPENIEAIINRCLEKKPEDRYQSFEEIIQDFENSELRYRSSGSKIERKGGTTKTKQRRTYIAGFGILLIAIMISIFAASLFNNEDNSLVGVAIIPFNNVGELPENRILLDGILETMTSKLSQIDHYKDAFWVIPSSEIINGNIKTPMEAFKTFGVNLAVTGSLQDIGGDRRLTMNLIDAEKFRQINSSVMDISGDNILNLQSQTVLELIGMLDVTVDDNIQETLQQGITNNPQSSAYYVNGKGYLIRYKEDEKLANAITLFKQAIQEDPNYALAHAALGEAFWRKFELTKNIEYVDSAQFYLDQANDINDHLIPVQRTTALIFAGTGRYEDAVDVYKSILDRDPRNDEVYGELGEAYQQLGMQEEAERSFKKAINLNPDHWVAYNRLGSYYLEIGNYEKAIEPYKQIIRLAPDNSQGYSNLGVTYYYLTNLDEAISYFKKSFELSPTFAAASNLGTMYRVNGDFESAMQYYEIAADMSPNDFVIWGNIASLYGLMEKEVEEKENYLKAIEVAEKLLEVNPNSVHINISLGSYYSDVGDKEMAIRFINKTLNIVPDAPDVLFRAGSAYEKLGERTEALELLKKAVESGYSIENIMNEPELKDLIQDEDFQVVQKAAK